MNDTITITITTATETEGWNDFLPADYVETTKTDCENNAYWM
jgi:hypothetical protein